MGGWGGGSTFSRMVWCTYIEIVVSKNCNKNAQMKMHKMHKNGREMYKNATRQQCEFYFYITFQHEVQVLNLLNSVVLDCEYWIWIIST